MRTFSPFVFVIIFALFCSGLAPAQSVPISEAEIRALSAAVHEGDQDELDQMRALAESGESYAQLALGAAYANEPNMRDFAESAKWSLAAARQGSSIAQVNIGDAYAHGRGVEQDREKAIFWLQMAADQGEWMGAGSLGDLYRGDRRDAPGDFVHAYQWYTVGARILAEAGRPEIRKTMLERRGLIARSMTMPQIAEAEGLAAQWVRREWRDLEPRLGELP